MSRKTVNMIRKVFLIAFSNLLAVIILFLVFEGLSSSVFVIKNTMIKRVIRERPHVMYDEEIGWISLPNVYIKDMFGLGIYLKTNSQFFRNEKDFSMEVPDDKVRIICSGDSYTFGEAVDNDHTWCQQLVSINNKLETINMGQSGYGVDQAYLWYKRNSTKFEHNIHIFAFITTDFRRMQLDNFIGYGKPILELQNGVIVIKNTPVPKHAYYPSRIDPIKEWVKASNSYRLVKKLLISRSTSNTGEINDTQTREVVSKIFKDLNQINQEKNSILVLVHLPIESDFTGTYSESWQRFLHNEAIRNNLIYIDLIKELRNYPPQEVKSLFGGHYSEKGNAYFADILYKQLSTIPKIAQKLQK